jgi:hypothetical protein
LAPTIASLALHVDECRVALLDLQVISANIKKKHSGQFRQSLSDIRAHIIAAWRSLIVYLQEILSFGDEINCCPSEAEPKALDDLAWTIAIKAMDMARELSNATSTSQDIFNNHKASISKLLSADLSSLRRHKELLVTLPDIGPTSNPVCKCSTR